MQLKKPADSQQWKRSVLMSLNSCWRNWIRRFQPLWWFGARLCELIYEIDTGYVQVKSKFAHWKAKTSRIQTAVLNSLLKIAIILVLRIIFKSDFNVVRFRVWFSMMIQQLGEFGHTWFISFLGYRAHFQCSTFGEGLWNTHTHDSKISSDSNTLR